MATAPGNVQYSYAQLQGIWVQAGGNKQNAAMAAAIAMAESGGNSAAYGNNTNGTIDRGLWQINSIHGSQSSFDVMTNARAAIAISNNGANWRPWCTAYADGACGTQGGGYLAPGSPFTRYLQGGVPPDLNAPINATNAASNQTGTQTVSCNPVEWFISPGSCAAGSVASGGEKIAAGVVTGLIGTLINPIIQLVAGVMGITGGVILMGGGIFLIVQNTQAYQETKQAGQQAQKGVGMMAFLAGPEAGAAEEAGAASKGSNITKLIGGGSGGGRSRQAPQPRQASTAENLRAEAARYRAYAQATDAYRKARQAQ